MLSARIAIAALLMVPTACHSLPKCSEQLKPAVQRGKCDVDQMRDALKNLPDGAARCMWNNWPLLNHAARKCDDEAMIGVLLDAGAQVMDVGNGPRAATALSMATLKDQVRSARALLRRGANPEIEDAFGRTCMERARSQEMRKLLQRAIDKRSTRRCEEAGAAECAAFVVALQGRVLLEKEKLIRLGLGVRKRIDELQEPPKGSSAAATARAEFFGETEALIAVKGSNAAQKVFARSVAFIWRSRVLCKAERARTSDEEDKNSKSTKNRSRKDGRRNKRTRKVVEEWDEEAERRSLERSYSDFLCAVLPKMKEDAAKDLMEPLGEALDKHPFDSLDDDGNGVLSKGEFQRGIERVKQELNVNSNAFGGEARARRLLGGVGDFCASASDTGRLWEVSEGRAAAAASMRLGSAARLAAAGCAACVALAAAVAVGRAVRSRPGRPALLVEEREVE